MHAPKTLTVTAILLAALTLSGCSAISTLLNGEGDVFSLEVGDCMDDYGTSDDITSVPIVDCDEEHDAEVYAVEDIDSDSYPGDSAVSDEAEAICLDAWEDFVGISYEDSLLNFSTLTPSEQSWGLGDKEVVCTISKYDENGELVKVSDTLEGSME
jgi:hypothetical protein